MSPLPPDVRASKTAKAWGSALGLSMFPASRLMAGVEQEAVMRVIAIGLVTLAREPQLDPRAVAILEKMVSEALPITEQMVREMTPPDLGPTESEDAGPG